MLLRLLILRPNQSETGTSIYHNASFASSAYSGAATRACGYGSESTSPEELQKYIQGQMFLLRLYRLGAAKSSSEGKYSDFEMTVLVIQVK